MKKILITVMLLLGITIINIVHAQELQYSISGTQASVKENTNCNFEYIYGYWERDSHASCYSDSSYTIPEYIIRDGYKYIVTGIGNYAFGSSNIYKSGSSLKEIHLPNTLLKIGIGAFNASSLREIIIPSNVQEMHGGFDRCNRLRRIIYTPATPPSLWTATDLTYVPDKKTYGEPPITINNPCVYEMISFSADEFTYTGEAPTPTWTNNIEGFTASLTMPTALNKEVGSYEVPIPVTFTSAKDTFSVNVIYRYTIKPATIVAKVSNVSREYGEENPPFEITYSGFQNDENESIFSTLPIANTSATKKSNAGEYPITISGGKATNYEFSYQPGTLTITKVPLTAKVRDASKQYGKANPSFSIQYNGLKNNESTPKWTISPTIRTEATQHSDVGQYIISAYINENNTNYDLKEIENGILTITPARLTISAKNLSRAYYSENPTLVYTCSGFVNGDNENTFLDLPLLSTSATKQSSVGTYDIIVSGASISENYSINYVNGTLTITPRTLTVSAKDCERFYLRENPPFEVTYSGFVGNEDESVLTTTAIAYCEANKYSNAGRWPIYTRSASADNYTMNYRNGWLTIHPAFQTITWNQEFRNVKVGDQIELTATSSSNLPITYEISDPTMASTYSLEDITFLNLKQAGTIVIQAKQNGNINYNEAERVTKTIKINDDTGISDYQIRPEDGPYTIYDLLGRQLNEFKPGVNIIRFANGTTKKVVITNLTM